ncbi:flagellar biosynthesis protein FlhF [Pelotomaculum propionicicum]|uniref:flagellar biosynthesis protein FlhF n=1 Tax=Pelotomaculum propionicicum TaxID=258475 RepID=UPI003B82BE33
MKIKRYLVREMQEAIRLIKQDLGSDAVIVSSYKVAAKGLIGLFSPRLLEVTAVLDDNPEIQLSVGCPPAQMAVTAGNESAGEIGPAREPARVIPAGRHIEINRARKAYIAAKRNDDQKNSDLLSQELKRGLTAEKESKWSVIEDLDEPVGEEKQLFETMVDNVIKAGSNGDPGPRWRKTLLDMDIGEDIVEQLLSSVGHSNNGTGANSQDAYFSLIKQVTRLLEPAYHEEGRPRIYTFMGPPGGGKTTSLAKLATRLKIYDHRKIALVGISNYRIGSYDQLQAYGNFLGVPVEAVMTPAELAKILGSHADKDFILIDTDGRSAWNARQVLELKSFLNVLDEPHESFLVLSASSKNRDLVKTAGEFQRIGFTKFIFTRVDETETHGSILNLVLKTGAPVAYLAHGQEVPDDISDASPKVIAKLLFKGVDPD